MIMMPATAVLGRTVAERLAGFPNLDGGLWHPYRCKWATERKDHPLEDVTAAGEWKDIGTLLESYQQPDPDTPLGVMEGGRNFHEPTADPEERQRGRKRASTTVDALFDPRPADAMPERERRRAWLQPSCGAPTA
jgi:hypothetical protein